MVNRKNGPDLAAQADRLRFAFSALGCTKYSEVAKMLGASTQVVQAWMVGRRAVPHEYQERLHELGISLDWLYFGKPLKLAKPLFPPGRPRLEQEDRI